MAQAETTQKKAMQSFDRCRTNLSCLTSHDLQGLYHSRLKKVMDYDNLVKLANGVLAWWNIGSMRDNKRIGSIFSGHCPF
jgi:hypothetical protein